MRISKRKIDLVKYGGRHRIWIKPYRHRMRTWYYLQNIEYDTTIVGETILQIPKYRIIERRGKLRLYSFIDDTSNIKVSIRR